MENPIKKDLNRREFLGATARALFAGIAIQIMGCDDNTSISGNSNTNALGNPIMPDAPGTSQQQATTHAVATADRTAETISANHGHVATVTGVQLDNGGAIAALDIQGSAPHTHTIALTGQDMADIKAGKLVSKTSTSTIAHTHIVTFAMVSTAIIPRHV